MSPNHPNDYPSSIQCVWLIDLGLGHKFTLTFHEFELEKKEDCSYDWVSVREGNTDTSPEIMHVCGDLLPPTITSEGPIRIYFKTDTDSEFSGFHMTYETQGRMREKSKRKLPVSILRGCASIGNQRSISAIKQCHIEILARTDILTSHSAYPPSVSDFALDRQVSAKN